MKLVEFDDVNELCELHGLCVDIYFGDVASMKPGIEKLSGHLFWDVDVRKLDLDKNRKLIIHRVLDYGLLGDWHLINDIYGLDEIAMTALTIKDLDKKSMSFVSLLSGIPEEKFLCYTTRLSPHGHWIS